MKTYRVRVPATVELIYEVEAGSQKEAKAEAEAMVEECELPERFETTSIGKAKIEKEEAV